MSTIRCFDYGTIKKLAPGHFIVVHHKKKGRPNAPVPKKNKTPNKSYYDCGRLLNVTNTTGICVYCVRQNRYLERDSMERIPKETRTKIKRAYNKLMKQQEKAFVEAYPVGAKFVKKYVDRRDSFDATFVIVGYYFSYASYDRTEFMRPPLFWYKVLYKKLDKRGRPNGKMRQISADRFDAGCHLGTC